jgi:hypothetical protein
MLFYVWVGRGHRRVKRQSIRDAAEFVEEQSRHGDDGQARRGYEYVPVFRTRYLKTLTLDGTAAGFKAMFLTLDGPRLGRRLNEYRNSFGLPKGMEYPNLFPGVDLSNLVDSGDEMAYGKFTKQSHLEMRRN